jgi:hypothetical protein
MQAFPTIRLAIPRRVPAAFDDADWVFELKHDGFRALAYFSSIVPRPTRAYNPTMKWVFSCLLLLITSLTGQSVRGMKQVSSTPEQAVDLTLAALKDASASQSHISQTLAHVMMRLADNNQRPPWPVVVNFTDKLTRWLVGRQLNNAQITAMRECIVEVMRRTGTSNAGLASRFQQALIGLGIDSSKTQLVVGDFIAIREAVQGPDDSPLLDRRFSPPKPR